MSSVTNVMIHVGYTRHNDPVIQKLNKWCVDNNHGQFTELDRSNIGGRKGFEAQIYLCAFNYLRLDDFFAYLVSLPWSMPEFVQIIWKDQHEELFSVKTLTDISKMTSSKSFVV